MADESVDVSALVVAAINEAVQRRRRKNGDPLSRVVDGNRALRAQLFAAQQGDVSDAERVARSQLADNEASERAHVARMFKTETAVLQMDAKRERQARAADAERARLVEEHAEALRRLKAALDRDVAAVRSSPSAQRSRRATTAPSTTAATPAAPPRQASPARLRARELREEVDQLRQERTRQFAARLEDVEADFNATCEREQSAISAQAATQGSERSQRVKERADRERNTRVNDRVAVRAAQNRERSRALRTRTDELQKSVLLSREQFRAKSCDPYATRGEKSARPERSRTPAVSATAVDEAAEKEAEVERRRSELSSRRAERLDADRRAAKAHAAAYAERLKAVAQADDEKRKAQRRADADSRRRQEAYKQEAVQASQDQRELQRQLAAVQAERLAHRVAERSAAGVAERDDDESPRANLTQAQRRDVERARDIAKHREMTVLRKRAAESEEEKLRVAAVEQFRVQRGSGSGDMAAAEAARDERQRVFAERRRREALEAAQQRDALQAQRLAEKQQAAAALREDEAAMEERRIVVAAEDEWEKRDRVERARVARAAAIAPVRFQHRVFTPHRDRETRCVTPAAAASPIVEHDANAADVSALSFIAASSTENGALALMASMQSDPAEKAPSPGPQDRSAISETPSSVAPTPASPPSAPRRHGTAEPRDRRIRLAHLDDEARRVEAVAEFPSRRGVALLRRDGASPAVVSAAERLLVLRQEQEALERDVNRRRGDVLAIRRDRAALAASTTSAPRKEVSKRLTERTLLQEAGRANILAAIEAERVARATSDGDEGETMATRHAKHGKVRGCNTTLYDPRKIEAAKERQAERHMLAAIAAQEREESVQAPRGPADERVIQRFHTAPLKRAEMGREKLAAAEEKRFNEVALQGSAARKRTAEEREATVSRLTKPVLAHRAAAKSPSPAPKITKDDAAALASRLYDGAVAKQRAEGERLAGEYLKRAEPVKLPAVALKASAQRMYEGKRE